MSLNNISDVTAALGAITPQGVNNGVPTLTNSLSTGTHDSSGIEGETLTSQSAEVGGGSSSFGRYNKQMLISNYLNRGKGKVDKSYGLILTGPTLRNAPTMEGSTQKESGRELGKNQYESQSDRPT
ncbi:hypothetical protein DFH28DRAFT_935536 [Melampsora americana]|nr:hypothetical protein DFH28DRAFT_935536 [Melampsora americana]